MPCRYPYTVEFVDSEQASIPRRIGPNVVIPEIVRVDVPLYRKTVVGLDRMSSTLRAQTIDKAIEEAKVLAYEKFVLSLQIVAEYEPYFRIELLRGLGERGYVLLVPPAHWGSLRMQVALPGTGRSLHARYDEFEFEILAHPRLHDNEAYIIPVGKYQLFLHVRTESDEVCISRSEFLDNAPDGAPPIAVQVRHLLAEIVEERWISRPTRLSGLGEVERFHPAVGCAKCPQCSGRLLHLSSDEAFCLDCDWDNLKVLMEPAAFTE